MTGAGGIDGEPITVVVADDDGRVRHALTDLLGDHPDLQVVGAVDSGSAVAALCSDVRPHLAMVDVVMEMGGVAAVHAIHRVSPGTVVVAYTARRDRRTRERLLAAGAAAVFIKGALVDLADALVELCRGGPSTDDESAR